jgi:peptidoglycan hydrolase-like protein with peptidoglycan-binding domain
MKRGIVYFVVALFVVSLVRADQTIQSVQQALKDQGFYYGNVTGDKSAETTAAIRRYQIRNGLQVTGDVNPETLRSLNLSSAQATRDTSNSAATQPNRVPSNNRSRLEQNLSPHVSRESDRQLEMDRSLAVPPYESAPPRINRRMVAEVQHQLMIRGYYRSWIDGRYGPRTAFAVRAFQSASGIPPTGRLDMLTFDALELSDRNMAYLEPVPQQDRGWISVKKFKHGKWKVKWKKYHAHRGNEDGERQERNGDDD